MIVATPKKIKMARPQVENKRKAYKVFFTEDERKKAGNMMEISGKRDFSEWARNLLLSKEGTGLKANPMDVIRELGSLRSISESIAESLEVIVKKISDEEMKTDERLEFMELMREYVDVRKEMIGAVKKLYRTK